MSTIVYLHEAGQHDPRCTCGQRMAEMRLGGFVCVTPPCSNSLQSFGYTISVRKG
jgi:hypothetical protein